MQDTTQFSIKNNTENAADFGLLIEGCFYRFKILMNGTKR